MRSFRALALLFVAVLAWAAPAARAQEGELGDNDGRAFLIVSLNRAPIEGEGDGTFAYDTTVTLIPVGTLLGGGPEVGDTRFLLDANLPLLPLPTISGFDLEDLNGNQATILGGFQTVPPGSEPIPAPHIIMPVDPAEAEFDGVPQEIQDAVFQALRSPGFSALLPNDGDFPTTADIAEYIATFLPEESGYDAEEIADYIFDTDLTVNASTSSCEGEAGIFPWEPGAALFTAGFNFDETGEVGSFDMCLIVEAAVSCTINPNKKGTIPVTIYSSDTFDTDDILEETIEIGGVAPDKVTFSANKVVAHFSVPALKDAGLLEPGTTELVITAMLFDDSCIEGFAAIKLK